ncbi:MAG: glutamate--tRNA ligase [Bacilli bacterium]|nr:glutamate--tRNA ligase [Bacilli bacterium]
MTSIDLANLIFPDISETVEDIKKKYPDRELPEGAAVTRFAPSPTGFVHIGNFQQAVTDYILAHQTKGIFYLRNEDTDGKREKEGAYELIINTLKDYELMPSEYEYNGEIIGNYGPYRQRKRKDIYQTFIKYLIEIDRAYPCFCSKEKLDETREKQERYKQRTGYYGPYSTCRKLSIDEAYEQIKKGKDYIIRFKSKGNFEEKFRFDDLVKGKLLLPENDEDFVIMKSDGLPTYHFAHIVDDYLMGTTHVIRGEEWISSVPKHIEMFKAFGFKPPKYIHSPLIMKKDEETAKLRKISKRKDPEALMTYYTEHGYPTLAVIESLMTIINTNYEEWHMQNPDKSYLDFEYSPKKMSASGGLYDLDKLKNISKTVISKMTKEELCNNAYKWACTYSEELKELIDKDKDYFMSIINIEREQKKPRKDITKYEDIIDNIWYMYDDLYYSKDKKYDWQKINNLEEINRIIELYLDKYLDLSDKDTWFNKIKELTDELGYCSNMKEYKNNPDNYKGSVADISTVLRVALTSKSMTPDLYEIMNILGKDKVVERYKKI